MPIDKIDITEKQLHLIKSLLHQYIPYVQVWAYGSRVNHTSTPASDLDMVAFIDTQDRNKIYLLKEAFEESMLPFSIDLFIWSELPPCFHKNIIKSHLILQSAPS